MTSSPLFIDFTGRNEEQCAFLINVYANAIRRCGTIAQAEELVLKTPVRLGGGYRDLMHRLVEAKDAALLAVERRHFESSHTSC